MILMIDPHHIWNIIYNARSNKSQPPTSPNIAPATQMNLMINPRHIWNVIYNARSKHSQPPTSPNTAPATKSASSRFQRKLRELFPPIERRFDDIPRIIRTYSEDNPRIKSSSRTRRFGDLTRPILETHFVWKNSIWRSAYLSKFHEVLRLPRKVTLQRQQILRLPRKISLMIDPRHIWNVIYNARSNKSQTPTSPNTAPATQNESHDWSASHMKRHLQCAEQAQSAFNLTKYCACHEICKFKISAETPWIASANRKTIRTDSEHDPTMIRPWNRHLAPAASETLLVPSWRRILYGKIPLRLSPKMSPNAAPATKSHTPTSPKTAPATQNESHDWSASHMKRHLNNARSKHSQPPTSPNTAPATKSVSSRFQRKHRELLPPIERRFEQIPSTWSEDKIVISHPPLRRPDSSHLGDAFCMDKYNISRSGYLPKCHHMLRLPRKVTLQLHQILRLPRKMHPTLL